MAIIAFSQLLVITPQLRILKETHPMRRILFVLVAVVALAGVIAYMGPASGQADKRTRDELAGKLARREVQRSPLSIPGREMVQVETLIPAGVESGWHVHPGEEVGYIIAGEVEMRVQGRATVVLRAGDGFLIPPRTPHNARDPLGGPAALRDRHHSRRHAAA
jgi:quercetin dioxygenase-like cupin family protein